MRYGSVHYVLRHDVVPARWSSTFLVSFSSHMDNQEERVCLVEINGTANGYGSIYTNGKHGNGTHWKQNKENQTKESGNEEKYQSGLIGLFRYATKTDKLVLSVGLVASVIHGASFPMLALVFGQMTNVFIAEAKGEEMTNNTLSGDVSVVDAAESARTEEFTTYLSHYSINYFYIGVVVLMAAFTQTVCWEMACERQVHRLRQVAFSQILRQDIAWYDTRPQGSLANLLSDDVERIREGIGCKFSMVTQYVSTFLSGTVVGLLVNWKLTAALLLVAPVLIGASAYLAKLTASSAAREQLKYSIAGGVAQEVLTSMRTVAAFGTERNEVERYDRALESGRKLAMRKYVVLAWGLTVVFFLMYAQYGLAFYYGAVLIEAGYCSPGSVFTVFFSVLSGAFTLGNALPYVNCVATALGSASSVFSVCDRTPRVDAYSEGGQRPAAATFSGHVHFRNVHFSYPSRHGAQVLRGLDLDIQPGQTVALVGPSGSGKSTVIQLLLRFYDVDSGVIEVDGRPLRELSVAWLRGAMGVVSQEPVMFGVSIAENIRYGRPTASRDDVELAATMANAHGFIDELPQGYDTLVGERGAQLSGGQKQRIAIARALVRDPALLLLDEATSALDAEGEAVVQDALERAMHGRTTVVVAHRLSTVLHADCICVLDAGRIVEQGSHDQLMARRGLYRQLVSTQAAFQADHELTDLLHMTEGSDVDLQVMRHRRGIHISQTSLYQLHQEAFPEGTARPVSLWSLVQLHRPECGWLVCGILGCALSGSIMPFFAFFYGEVFATFTKSGAELMEAAVFWSFMFVALGVLAALSIWLEVVMMTVAVEKLVMRLRVMAFSNILRQPVGWFDLSDHSSGRLTTRLARDAPLIKGAAGLRLGQLLSSLVTLVAALSVAFVFGWQLALLLLLIVPLIAAGAHQQTRMMRRTQLRDNRSMDDAGRLASECVDNMKTVQALGMERCFATVYAGYLVQPFEEAKKQAVVYALVFALSQAVIYLMYAAAFRYGAYLIQVEAMTPSEVYRVFFALAFCAASVGTSSAYVQDYSKAKLAATQMFNLIDRKSEIDAMSPKGLKPVVQGLVMFDRVSFHYPARPDVRVLRGLTLSVAPGQTLAIVGQSGCGKSTLVALLQRFYQPTDGRVMLDNVDIEEMNVRHLRRHIGLVTQEPTLFNQSIRANIAYGLAGADDPVDASVESVTARVVEAATTANCHAFITQLPLGYDTLVGEGGCQLSGGQKQRIAIARALIRDPRILLLDEATSALDSESEKLVQEALDKARTGRTCIVIAHRLSTVQNADVIAVLDQGKIREMGSHLELTAQRGLYYQLVKAQQL